MMMMLEMTGAAPFTYDPFWEGVKNLFTESIRKGGTPFME